MAVLSASGAAAEDAEPHEKRARALVVNGLFRFAHEFDETRTVTLFAEKGTVDTTYRAAFRPGGEIGLQYGLGRRWGLQAAAGASSRSGRGAYRARLPHPLYLDAHRESEGTLGGLSYLELAGHVGVSLAGRAGTLGYTFFAGPSVYRVQADLIDRAQTQESYPYDDATFTLPTVKTSRIAPGLHAGASLAYPLSPKLSLGLQTRYGYGRVVLAPNAEDETPVTAGGPQLALGVRWAF